MQEQSIFQILYDLKHLCKKSAVILCNLVSLFWKYGPKNKFKVFPICINEPLTFIFCGEQNCQANDKKWPCAYFSKDKFFKESSKKFILLQNRWKESILWNLNLWGPIPGIQRISQKHFWFSLWNWWHMQLLTDNKNT